MQKSQITPFVVPQDSAVYAEHVAFSYSTKKRDKNKVYALSDVSLDIKRGEFVAIVGHTGSGKSTFLQHFNALVRLQNGNMSVLGIDLSAKKARPQGVAPTGRHGVSVSGVPTVCRYRV